jgi:hypothetical protein
VADVSSTRPRPRWHPGVGAAGLLAASVAAAAAAWLAGDRAAVASTAWLLIGAAAGFAVSGST